MLRSVLAVILLCAGGFSAGNAAQAGEPRALVLDVTGKIEPETLAFDELAAGALIELAPGAEISLTFYPTCEDLTVRGGSITVKDRSMLVGDNGEVVAYTKSECPGTVTLAVSDTVLPAIVTRSIRPDLTALDPDTVIAVSGPDADLYTRVAIHGSDGEIGSAPIIGRRAAWADGMPALVPARQYRIVVSGPGAQMRAASVVAATDGPAILLLRQ